MRRGTNSHISVATAAWTASASATPPGVVAQDLADPKRREREQAVAHRRVVELAQTYQVLLGHAVALLCHLPVEPLDLLAVGIRQHDTVLRHRAQGVRDRGGVGVGLAAVAVEEELQCLTHMRRPDQVSQIDDHAGIVAAARQGRGGARK
jgi:hypothetical protein